jgi:group II intron reverse transcriptase/maturase
VRTKLQCIAQKARKEPGFKFTSLFHLMNEDHLRECYAELRGRASAGIDQVTKEEYGKNLEENLTSLVNRLHTMSYTPQPVRRVYIPKAGSDKKRPLGIPSLEDKLVQAGLVRILEAIYEKDFIEGSYGFRPDRGCHDALRALSHEVELQPVHYIVEADVKGFFDNVKHDWLMKFLEHRVGDKRVLRYIKRFLRAGVQEDGQVRRGREGTPQGGVISPLLANIYLHYSLDLWFEKFFSKTCYGNARLIRYADDWVTCFQKVEDAERFYKELPERLGKFGLEVAPEKTKIIEFGPLAIPKTRRKGEKPQTFDFLGFTHYCDQTRKGGMFRMRRLTSRKKFAAKLQEFKEWLKASRTLSTRALMEMAASKMRGHYAYYGVSDNGRGISRFHHEATALLHKWLNRRGRRGCVTWDKFQLLLRKFPLPKPRVTVNLLPEREWCW